MYDGSDGWITERLSKESAFPQTSRLRPELIFDPVQVVEWVELNGWGRRLRGLHFQFISIGVMFNNRPFTFV